MEGLLATWNWKQQQQRENFHCARTKFSKREDFCIRKRKVLSPSSLSFLPHFQEEEYCAWVGRVGWPAGVCVCVWRRSGRTNEEEERVSDALLSLSFLQVASLLLLLYLLRQLELDRRRERNSPRAFGVH